MQHNDGNVYSTVAHRAIETKWDSRTHLVLSDLKALSSVIQTRLVVDKLPEHNASNKKRCDRRDSAWKKSLREARAFSWLEGALFMPAKNARQPKIKYGE